MYPFPTTINITGWAPDNTHKHTHTHTHIYIYIYIYIYMSVYAWEREREWYESDRIYVKKKGNEWKIDIDVDLMICVLFVHFVYF